MDLITVKGSVEDIIYQNPENGYIVFTIDYDGEYLSIYGNLGEIVEGETLVLNGYYTNSPKYGRQFKAEYCERYMPDTAEGIRKYLGSGIIKGLGPAMAKKIVAAFGDRTLEIIETEPHRLSSLSGITAARAKAISDEYQRINSVRVTISYLAQYGVSPLTAVSAWKRYGESTTDLVRRNPYILCENGIEVEFQQIDSIAAEMGFEYDNLNRIVAGIVYVLRENTGAGNTCLPLSKLKECVCDVLHIESAKFERGLEEGVNSEQLIFGESAGRAYVYLAEYFSAESYVSARIATMIKQNNPSQTNYDDEIRGIEWTSGIKYEALQKKAISDCLTNNVFILTGGPGTGKTTTLNAVIMLCQQRRMQISLCAPTGRAAQRLAELTSHKAQTIHRLLEVDPSKEDRLSFKKNEKNPLQADVVIVDEMSMVDMLLMDALLRAIPTGCKLIMVGDSNQLPSVGAGNILRDLIASQKIPMVELKEIFRQAAESLIVMNAHKIVNGQMPDLDDRTSDFFFMKSSDGLNTVRMVVDLCKNRLPNTYGYSPLTDIQVLSPSRIGESGTKELNRHLQHALNPPAREKKEVRIFDTAFRLGDKVMQTRNDYDVMWQKGAEKGTGVFNGDIGYIVEVGKLSDYIVIDFDGKKATYTPDMMQRLELAYAVTVHKSQGSEYDAVIIPLPDYKSRLMYRSLLYTAVTRAKKILIIVGQKEMVYEMVNQNKKMVRYSCLRKMLEADLGDVINDDNGEFDDE